MLHDIILKYCNSLESTGQFGDSDTDSSKYMEPPTRLLWVKNCLAQSYSRCMNFQGAIKMIDSAIVHTPTCADLYVTKSNIYKVISELVSVPPYKLADTPSYSFLGICRDRWTRCPRRGKWTPKIGISHLSMLSALLEITNLKKRRLQLWN